MIILKQWQNLSETFISSKLSSDFKIKIFKTVFCVILGSTLRSLHGTQGMNELEAGDNTFTLTRPPLLLFVL